MNIIICLKEVIDTRLNLGYGQVSNALFQKGLSYHLNPQDAGALSQALKIKAQNSTHQITLVSLGPERVDNYLKEGLAQGSDKAVRIWEDGFQFISTYLKARILARAVSLMDADLVLTGAKSLDNGSGLVGPLMAAWLKMPCICEATWFQVENGNHAVTVTRNIRKGVREKLLATLPVVLALSNNAESLPYVSMGKLLASQETKISQLSLADLGIAPVELQKDPVPVRSLSSPRPRPKAAPLDSSLPAYDRILALLQGGLSKRSGQILQGNTDDLVNQLYTYIMKEKDR